MKDEDRMENVIDRNNRFEVIELNRINGNISDYRKAIRKLSKLDMLNFLEYVTGNFGTSRHVTIYEMRGALLE
jgi:hypothetical protein